MSDETDAWRKRWKVLLRCRDCNETYECVRPDVTLQRVHGFNRLILVGGPEVCPECKNLKTVSEQDD